MQYGPFWYRFTDPVLAGIYFYFTEQAVQYRPTVVIFEDRKLWRSQFL